MELNKLNANHIMNEVMMKKKKKNMHSYSLNLRFAVRKGKKGNAVAM